MKLRTTHNSVRIRVRKSELVTLQENGRVQDYDNENDFLFVPKEMLNGLNI